MKFKCVNCNKEVSTQGDIGTRNRNHCPFCLHSVHLDENISGDRKSDCKGIMLPVGIAFKNIKKDRYGKEKYGEIMIIHKCSKCGSISKNRIAGDDDAQEIIKLAESSASEKEFKEINKQLFGE